MHVIATTAAQTACRSLDAVSATVWLLEHDQQMLIPVASTDDTTLTLPIGLHAGTVAAAARGGRTLERGAQLCVPLVVATRVTGVLEIDRGDTTPLRADVRALVEMLAIHASGAIENAHLHRRTEELSETDALTQLKNRRRLEADLDLEVRRARRYGRPLTFVMIDIDRFKIVNDTLGHRYGDEVLQRIARLLADTARSSDSVYRYGGEELAILLRDSERSAGTEVAERCRQLVERMFAAEAVPVTFSAGVAELPADADDVAGLIGAADARLYDAKHRGRNRVVAELGRV